MRKTTTAVIITGTAIAGITAGIVGTALLTPEHVPTTPACATEDATGCYWDSHNAGNNEGESFYVDNNGAVYYAYDAHCDELATGILANAGMLLTAWENGTGYTPEFRTDNYDVYADQLAACNSDTPGIQ